MSLHSNRDIARYFQQSGIQVRPDACQLVLTEVGKISFHEHKQEFLKNFLKQFNEFQALNDKSRANQGIKSSTPVLDTEVVQKIFGSQAFRNTLHTDEDQTQERQTHSNRKRSATPNKQQQDASFMSFKNMKQQQAQSKKSVDSMAGILNQDEPVQSSQQDQVMIEPEKIDPIFYDKIMKEMGTKVVVLDQLLDFPKINCSNGQLSFHIGQNHSSLFDVNKTRTDYFLTRLALVAECLFSHQDKYVKAKLDNQSGETQKLNQTVVYNLHSTLGSKQKRWVFALLTQKEDSCYYLEDQTLCMKVLFSDLEHVETDSFFTENMILLCEVFFRDDALLVTRIQQPPLHAKKSLKFKINEQDYFGSYNKLQTILQEQTNKSVQDKQASLQNEVQMAQPCIIVLSQVELDQLKTFKGLEKLFEGIEQMQPEMIVMTGNFVSIKNKETATFEKIKGYFDQLGALVRDQNLVWLRDSTKWLFQASFEDPGQVKIMPGIKFSEYFLSGFKGNGPNRIKNISIVPNPLRISFYGKEIVICRYNYMKKLKQNHLQKISLCQKRVSDMQDSEPKDDCHKLAKSVLHQGTLIPLPQIVQPLAWSLSDCLNLTPHPDFLVLADECQDYYYRMPINEMLNHGDTEKTTETVHVFNPGNFSIDQSFSVIYPITEQVEASKVSL